MTKAEDNETRLSDRVTMPMKYSASAGVVAL